MSAVCCGMCNVCFDLVKYIKHRTTANGRLTREEVLYRGVMTKKKFQGTGTALVTPFKKDGSIDEPALRRLVDLQVRGGIDMIFPCGTTGEGATLEPEEADRVLSIVIQE